VKWADSWEPEENLSGCPKLIEAYWKKLKHEVYGILYTIVFFLVRNLQNVSDDGLL